LFPCSKVKKYFFRDQEVKEQDLLNLEDRGRKFFPETSVQNYRSTLCNIHRTNILLSAVHKAHGKLECRYSSPQPAHRFLLICSPLVSMSTSPKGIGVSLLVNGTEWGEVPCWEEHNALSEIRGSHSMALVAAIRIFSNQIHGVTIRV
jgi:hypothetical protein